MAHLVEAGSHPDLMQLERQPRDEGGELARNITVDQVRSLQRLFTTTSSMSPWRCVIVDSVDDLGTKCGQCIAQESGRTTGVQPVSPGQSRALSDCCRRSGHAAGAEAFDTEDDVMTDALRSALPEQIDKEINDLCEVDRIARRALGFRASILPASTGNGEISRTPAIP
jgi:DNA polymerase-3 subunit delta'